MARWEPDADGRLKQAAMALFHERGYAEVTVAEIADRAGLTKRTFFNYFADKREVLFAGSEAYLASVVKHVAEAEAGLEPIDVAVLALTLSGLELAQYGEWARARRDLIASSTELQERDLIKNAALTSAIAEALSERQVEARTAVLAAQAAMAVFGIAYSDWVEGRSGDLPGLIQQSLADLRRAVAPN
jgi:AcrR family transcriptional regulator